MLQPFVLEIMLFSTLVLINMHLYVWKHYVENRKWEGESDMGACPNIGSCLLNIKHNGMGSFGSFQPDSDQKPASLVSNSKWGKCIYVLF